MDRGMLLVLTDVSDEDESEFNSWYDREHMRERVEVPGFLAARRYHSETAARRYCAVYDTESIDVFESAPYRQKLAAQSEWSKHVLTLFVDAHRSVGRIGHVYGYGYGRALWLLKVGGAEPGVPAALVTWMGEAAEISGVVAVRLFESEPRLSGPVKEYRPTTRPIMGPEGRLLLIDLTEPSVADKLPVLPRDSYGDTVMESLGMYSITWGLARSDVDRPRSA